MEIESNYFFKEHYDVCIINDQDIPSKKCIIIFSSIILLLLITIEIIIFKLLLIIIPYYIIIIIYVLFHLILLRYIMYTFIYPGKHFLSNFVLYKSFGYNRARLLDNSLENFIFKINKIIMLNKNKNENNNLIDDNIISTENKLKLSFKYIDIYLKIKEYYGSLNKYQYDFLNKLLNLKTNIENSSLYQNFEKYKKKEDIFLSQKDINDYENIKIDINDIQKLLKEYRGEIKINCKNIFKYIHNYFFNNLLSSKKFERISVSLKYPNSKEIKIKSSCIQLDCFIIYSFDKNDKKDDNISNNKNVVIMCGPNFTPFEACVNKWDLDSLYLSNNIDIFFWNYRGYGFSNGTASFSSCCKDVLLVYDYIIQNYNYNKILVHGLSIGGVSICYLALQRKIDLVIADRTFGTVKGLLESFSCGNKFLYILSKILLISSINNTENLMKAKCKKILLNDPEDLTISDDISLKSSMSGKLIYDIFNIHRPELNPNNIRSTNIIDYVSGQGQSNIIYNSFNYTINSIKNSNEYDSDEEDGLNEQDILFNEKTEKSNENQLIISSNITNNSLDALDHIIKKFNKKLYKLYSNFLSAGDNLSSFEDDNTLKHFNTFFNNLFIYGTEDLPESDYNFCNINNAEKMLNNFIEEADKFLNIEEMNQISDCDNYKHFLFFLNFIKKLKKFMSDINIQKIEKECFSDKKGELIPITCGHMGFYNKKEVRTIKYIIKEFLNINDEKEIKT